MTVDEHELASALLDAVMCLHCLAEARERFSECNRRHDEIKALPLRPLHPGCIDPSCPHDSCRRYSMLDARRSDARAALGIARSDADIARKHLARALARVQVMSGPYIGA